MVSNIYLNLQQNYANVCVFRVSDIKASILSKNRSLFIKIELSFKIETGNCIEFLKLSFKNEKQGKNNIF